MSSNAHARVIPRELRRYFYARNNGFWTFEPGAKKMFGAVTLDLIMSLRGYTGMTFSIYAALHDRVVERIRPEDFAAGTCEALDNWDSARFGPPLVLKSESDQWLGALQAARVNRISGSLANTASVDGHAIQAFTKLSSVGNLLEAGHVNTELARQAAVAAADAVDNIMCSTQAAATLSAMFTHDPSLYEHSAAVGMLSGLILWKCCPQLNVTRQMVQDIVMAGLYHDAGKSRIPPEILHKPAKLAPEEFEVIKTHPKHGADLLTQANQLGAAIPPIAIRVALEHHERMNGTGYPNRKYGKAEDHPNRGIHLYSRIVAIADVYSALIMKRAYKPGFDVRESLKIMNHEDGHFDREIFSSFVLNILNAAEPVAMAS